MTYDALLVVSFGGPEGPADVEPFLEHVTRGRGVPRERLQEVAAHYARFGGVSPIHARTRELVEALRAALPIPVFWGNRHAPPWLEDAVREMRDAGARRALAFATSAFASHPGCRAYLDDIEAARAAVEGAPAIDKVRPFHDHPGYVETCGARLAEALAAGPARVLLSAHSIPVALARTCAYEAQLAALCARLGAERVVYQSRSGPPQVPWLEPDVLDALDSMAREDPGARVVVAPFGFVADHMEVVHDLDVEARERAESLGLSFVRAGTANAHPRFVRMVAEILEDPSGTWRTPCAPDCCPPGRAR